MSQLGASLMCADFLNLGSQIQSLEKGNIDFYHIDIMDGQFVDNFALSIDFIKAIRPTTQKLIDVHLMVKNPDRYIKLLADAGSDSVSIHSEVTPHLQASLQKIKDCGMKAGVALNPATKIEHLDYVADKMDLLLLMTVNPGFAGQKFIPTMYQKIADAKKWIHQHNPNIVIEVDGNIGASTIPECHKNGAEMYVLGTSALFRKENTIEKNIEITRALFV
ncbi:ribulose-phosphate 3-epimerase [Bartonella tamiae]|uniref:Ribulose-phosphate 3-epimerase n=1 Tax=Bartonella tamiae Th239 TaxID=1094558 RepID=J1K0B8_9HYPH|nr:ribulose-phosphate 3-epimerase [Bartonella tamiae]EJF90430.1 ribulose-phosphate 3-epimerase [Bartonella tamiae Th239]EJF93626.1 ribulose-phosphate 3-epimerase [Bartonella tamiae Th307]